MSDVAMVTCTPSTPRTAKRNGTTPPTSHGSMERPRSAMALFMSELPIARVSWRLMRKTAGSAGTLLPRLMCFHPQRWPEIWHMSAITMESCTPSIQKPVSWLGNFRWKPLSKDPLKVLNADGSLNQEAFSPVFGDFEDMYI